LKKPFEANNPDIDISRDTLAKHGSARTQVNTDVVACFDMGALAPCPRCSQGTEINPVLLAKGAQP